MFYFFSKIKFQKRNIVILFTTNNRMNNFVIFEALIVFTFNYNLFFLFLYFFCDVVCNNEKFANKQKIVVIFIKLEQSFSND